MSERRKETRRKLMAFTPVYDLHPRTLWGYLADLTLHGALVVGEKPMAVGTETTLTIEFPSDLPDLNETKITTPVRVAWCHQDESPHYFNIGVEFTALTPQHMQIFQQILSRYHFRHILHDADTFGG